MNTFECQRFEYTDQTFLEVFDEAKAADPIALHSDGIHSSVVEANVAGLSEPPCEALKVASERVLDWASTSEAELDNPETHAILRDLDKILGSFVMRKSDPLTTVPISANALGIFLNSAYHRPRASFYDYALATDLNNGILDTTYTGDEREVSLIEIFREMTDTAHMLLNSVLRARLALQSHQKDEARAHLSASVDLTYGMRCALPDIYHRVGPNFVAMGLTRYVGDIEIKGEKYEGPNPSSSAFMAVDRFVFGSMESLRAKSTQIEDHLSKRMAYLPEHLRALIQAADNNGDNAPLWILAGDDTELVELAIQIGSNIRKFKVGHKGFADKGLAAKGGQITHENPDLLSDLIEYSRANEGKK